MSNEEQKHSVTVWLIIETSGGQDTSKYMDPKRGGKGENKTGGVLIISYTFATWSYNGITKGY